MKNIELDKIKDTVYELEGLLELARLRKDKTEELLPLMKSRLDAINRLFDYAEDSGYKEPDAEEYVEEESASVDAVDYATAEDTARTEEYSEPSYIAEEETAETLGLPENSDTVDIAGTASQTFSQKPAPRPAFCINDRFRFRRELFNNSDAEFSSAMDLVATMDNYEEAEEYFLGDLGWNEENADVTAFLDIIRQYFEK